MIPVYTMEEHNEAFYIWSIAAEKGYIDKEGNTLLHVDHHDDSECGAYWWDFTKSFSNMEEVKKFTYDVLGIADFIVPALYFGIFSKFYNMKSVVPMNFKSKERYAKRIGDTVLVLGDYVPFLHVSYRKEHKEGYSFYTYYEGSLSPMDGLENVVLDIDLDYFCWDDSLGSVPAKRMEITKEAYEEYIGNPYHPFRILPRRLIKAEEVEGRFFMRYEEPPFYEKKADEDRIVKRVERFTTWLRGMTWEPKVITLCRSVHSGYLPSQHAELVEKLVRNGLETIYKLDYQDTF